MTATAVSRRPRLRRAGCNVALGHRPGGCCGAVGCVSVLVLQIERVAVQEAVPWGLYKVHWDFSVPGQGVALLAVPIGKLGISLCCCTSFVCVFCLFVGFGVCGGDILFCVCSIVSYL